MQWHTHVLPANLGICLLESAKCKVGQDIVFLSHCIDTMLTMLDTVPSVYEVFQSPVLVCHMNLTFIIFKKKANSNIGSTYLRGYSKAEANQYPQCLFITNHEA